MVKGDVERDVYLIHLERPLPSKHPRSHYLGSSTRGIEVRLAEHRAGKGARMLAQAVKLGITFWVVRTWRGNYHDEMRLKKKKGIRLCPICNPAKPIPQ